MTSDTPFPPGALNGVRVLELAQALAVPFCGVLLSDMGAEVIKIEPPNGDGIRHTMEPITAGESKGFTLVNRGKRAICLDVTRADAWPVLRKLVAWADIVLVSMKPADLPRYGLTYEAFKAIRPDVIYLEHVPLGKLGPFGGDPGYDVVVQGMSGGAVITARERDGVPMNVRPAYNDMGTGCLSALAVVAALRHRELTGAGQRVETSLLSTAVSFAHQLVSWFAATDPPVEEAFNEEVAAARANGAGFEEQRGIWERHFMRGGYANIYFRHYRVRDGFISLGCLSPALNARFRAVTGLNDPRRDPDFDIGTPAAYDQLTILVRQAEDLFASKTRAEWLALLRAGGVPCGPLNFPPDVFHDPQLLANEYVIEIDHPVLGPYRTFGPPIRMDATPTRVQSPPPLLDEHTDVILAELGFDEAARARLREAKVTGKSQ